MLAGVLHATASRATARTRSSAMRSGDLQERAHALEELRQAIVMDPVSGALDVQDPRLAERARATVGLRIGRPRLAAAHEEHRTRDVAPDLARLVEVEEIGRHGAHEVVELPRVRPVLG